MNATYETIERCIEVRSMLTTEQFERCCALTHAQPHHHKTWGDRFFFHCDTDADLFAVQDYAVEQALPHTITTTREWRA